jgi:hypothetical protein
MLLRDHGLQILLFAYILAADASSSSLTNIGKREVVTV